MKLAIYLLLLFAPACVRGQVIITYAGTGIVGYSGDGGAATNAQFQELVGIATDTAGNLFIPDYNNNVIRKIDTGGIITTIAGTGMAGYSGDGGLAAAAQFNHPWNIAVTAAGDLYIAEQGNNTIRKINTAGIVTTFAGNGTAGYSGDGGAATAASFRQPWGIAFSETGDIYIADGANHCIRRVNPLGTISTIAGNGTAGYNGDNILAATAELSNPAGLLWWTGKLYIADKLNNRIRVINSGIISTVAGTGTQGYSGDGGSATAAKINTPLGLAADAAGNILFSDFGNNMVRKITGTTISRIAGDGSYGSGGDGGSPLSAQLSQPWGLATGKAGTVYIADKNNYKVRKIYTPPPSAVANITTAQTAVYPNPVTNTLTITSTDVIRNVDVYSMTGQRVYTQQYSSRQASVDLAALAPGTYLLRVNGAAVKQITKL